MRYVPGDDSTFLVDQFDAFLLRQLAASRPWLAHICFHAIHEPHPAMPHFYRLYAKDPDCTHHQGSNFASPARWHAIRDQARDLLDAPWRAGQLRGRCAPRLA